VKQDRGTRRRLNARKVAFTLAEIELIVWGDKKKGVPAQELTHKERQGYLTIYAKIAKTLSDADRDRLTKNRNIFG
jgi:hypothetical protein